MSHDKKSIHDQTSNHNHKTINGQGETQPPQQFPSKVLRPLQQAHTTQTEQARVCKQGLVFSSTTSFGSVILVVGFCTVRIVVVVVVFLLEQALMERRVG